MPPSLMFGHEMFSSMAATPSESDRMRETSTYSSSVVPQTLTMTVAPRARSSGSFSSANRRAPIPCRPIAFNMPEGVSTMRGAGCPSRSARNSPLDTIAPSVDRSTMSAYSTPYPKQPLAAISGFLRTRPPIRTDKSISALSQHNGGKGHKGNQGHKGNHGQQDEDFTISFPYDLV